jgi:DNA polymerase-3 subunit gamma/tau
MDARSRLRFVCPSLRWPELGPAVGAMTYVVLARKYRPRSFEQMVGQEHVVQALSNALTQGRLHHAYLFTGTRGIGKTTVSRILAKSLNCTGPDGKGGVTAQPCGVCQACTEIDADRYLDYIEMDAASNGGKDEIKDLIERAAYKPGLGRFKVFMIDEAHQLSKDAFNALLKTLEEPPEYLKFVLATTDPDKVLPTVLSRCLQFNLRPMAPEVVREHLQRVLQAEGVDSDEASLRLLSRAARGSMRDGLSLADQAIAYGGGRLSEDVVRTMLGSVDRGHARAVVEALARRDGAAVLAVVDGLRGLGLSATGTLEEVAQLLQQMAVEQAVPGALDDQEPETEVARALATALAPDETQLLYSMVLHGRAELSLMSDEYGALTMVLLRFLAFPAQGAPAAAREPRAAPLRASAPPAMSVPKAAPVPRVAPAPAAVMATQAPVASALTAAAPAGMAAPTPAATAAESALADRWDDVVKRLSEQGAVVAMVKELATQAGLRHIDAGSNPPRWHLSVAREPLRNPALGEKLAVALSALLGHAVVIALEAGSPGDTPAQRDAAQRARRQQAAEASIQQDPVVRELLQQFKSARIVPGSIKPV